ncbi:hypothetical protein EDB81DRAFT_920561 [Dactylonectria macrodidyma]|uniref:Uncharacterized protein n=1 Tax=Dactylonectria macrodidyma TaxID=307937 RepID=A0A9P9D8F4_9HYPO|nr:hypothetical protein EDB81DRAFT_920561 [Dactylonectria macrodidyma]
MSCQFAPNSTIVPGVEYWQFVESMEAKVICPSTCLRPDPGGALIPWLYTVFLLLFHLPACIIRALRWESAQYLALSLALLSVAMCIQSYMSTRLAASEVLVWMPLTLMLDVGAMLQMVVLIVERYEPRGTRRLGNALQASLARTWRAIVAGLDHPPRDPAEADIAEAPGARPEDNILTHAIVALVASALLVALVILQIYGLYAAASGSVEASASNLTVKWCSPSFRDFAIAISTGNCEIYEVTGSSSNGIGCISLPAQQQRDWLTITIAGLAAALVFEGMDLALIRCARGRQCRGVGMQRPWFTMFAGVLSLVILIAFGVFNAARLPVGVTDVVWIYRKEPMATLGRVCQGKLKAPGLRGMIIGWTDGLFDGWGYVYHGNVVHR